MAELVEPAFQRVVTVQNIVAEGQQRALDALYQVGTTGADPEGLPGLPQRIPEVEADGRIVGIDFEPALPAPARPRDDQRMAPEFQGRETEEADRADILAENRRHHILRLRPLHRQRADIGLAHRNVETETVRQPPGPQRHIGIGDRQPEAVLGQFEQYRIVDHEAPLVDQRRIEAPADGGGGKVARRHQLREARGVGPAQLHLALAADIPQLHVIDQMPIVLLQRPEGDGQQHVVVDRIGADPQRLDPGGIERPPCTARGGETDRHGGNSSVATWAAGRGRGPMRPAIDARYHAQGPLQNTAATQ